MLSLISLALSFGGFVIISVNCGSNCYVSAQALLQWQRDEISALRIMRWITCMAALAKLHGFNYLSMGSFSSHFSLL